VVSGAATRSPGAYDETALPDRSYTAAEVDAALTALVEPGRLAHAQDVVTHAAPTLQHVLANALAEGGWFGDAHQAEINRVAGEHDEAERATAMNTLVADQTRLGMFVGVAVGFELAHELEHVRESGVEEPGREETAGQEASATASQHDQTPTQEH
jgi:hypothetical protein